MKVFDPLNGSHVCVEAANREIHKAFNQGVARGIEAGKILFSDEYLLNRATKLLRAVSSDALIFDLEMMPTIHLVDKFLAEIDGKPFPCSEQEA